MLAITRRFEFDAAHRLVGHESLCRNTHGHRYVLEVAVKGPQDVLGRVQDFGVMKAVLGGWLQTHMDHAYLYSADDQIGVAAAAAGLKVYAMPTPPTAENILKVLVPVFRHLCMPLTLVGMKLNETPNCAAIWQNDDVFEFPAPLPRASHD